LADHAKTKASEPAVIFEDQQISWQELWWQVETTSRFFAHELGTGQQKVVALLMTNSIEFVSIYLAAVHAGHIVMPVDPVYKKLEIDAIIGQVGPAMIILQDRYASQLGRHSMTVVNASEVLKKDVAENAPLLRLSPQKQIISLTFTSGTSGAPKIVPNTHANHIWNIEVCSKVWDWTAHDSLLINLPLSHWYGLVMGLSGAIYHGNRLYLRQQSFNAKEMLEDLSSGKISLFTHTPLGYMKMLDQAGDYDLSKVRLFISGSAPFPPKLWHQFKKHFGVEVLETYGSSETGRIAANTPDDIKLGSPGRILPGVDVRLSRDHEVTVRSGGLFPGYWMNPQATKAASAEGGYWRTGDIGQLEDGRVILKGRVQERIRRFGYTISPRDVEWALLENPKIREVLVMGKQVAEQSNDRLTYFISGNINEDEIRQYCKANLPFSWRPDNIVILDAIPRTRNGKPKIGMLKEMAV